MKKVCNVAPIPGETKVLFNYLIIYKLGMAIYYIIKKNIFN